MRPQPMSEQMPLQCRDAGAAADDSITAVPYPPIDLADWKNIQIQEKGYLQWRALECEVHLPKPGGGLRSFKVVRGLARRSEVQEIVQSASGGQLDFVAHSSLHDDHRVAEADLVQNMRYCETPLAQVLRRFVESRLLPYLRDSFCLPGAQLFAAAVRRHRPHVNCGNHAHFNMRALVTAEICLQMDADNCAIFVQSGAHSNSRQRVPLQAGDVIVHQYDVCRGVHVLSGDHYTLILWFRDSPYGVYDHGDMTVWYAATAEAGDADAQTCLARLYDERSDGDGAGTVAALASKWYHRAATAGHPHAQCWYADFLNKNRGLGSGRREIIQWYQAAADQGLPEAQFKLALFLCDNEGDAEHQKTSLAWMQAAAMQGEPEAMYRLGVEYSRGQVVQQDSFVSAKWMGKAAYAGHAAAQYSHGVAYLVGEGVEQNWHLAREWFERAAQAADPLAECNLGVLYAQGLAGLPQDYAEAHRLYGLSAARGCVDGMYNLGLLHAKGLGVRRDLVTAYRYLATAAAQGHWQASNAVVPLAKTMLAAGLQVPTDSCDLLPAAPAAAVSATAPAPEPNDGEHVLHRSVSPPRETVEHRRPVRRTDAKVALDADLQEASKYEPLIVCNAMEHLAGMRVLPFMARLWAVAGTREEHPYETQPEGGAPIRRHAPLAQYLRKFRQAEAHGQHPCSRFLLVSDYSMLNDE